MSYSVKEIFYTLQGEGANAGRPAVFCRFAGCNLWSGRESDRASAVCKFCDTDFVGTDGTAGGKYESAAALAQTIADHWPNAGSAKSALLNTFNPARVQRLVVLTGGEPLLQVDSALVAALHAHQFEIAVETNGTIAPPLGIDWLCVSPKAGSERVVSAGQELKLVWPQEGFTEANLNDFEQLAFEHFYIQPKDVADGELKQRNTEHAVTLCMRRPQWRLSVQTHKVLMIR
jgi:7-carboxy-7-deazaguanine synthase